MSWFVKFKNNRYVMLLFWAVLCIALDQITKLLVLRYIPLYGEISVIPGFFNVIHIHNYGAAFGFLNRPDMSMQFWFFMAATLVGVGLIFYMVRTAPFNRLHFFGLGLILGGAIGNMIDRVRFRYVIDFLDVYVGDWHWPAFNIADACICVGAVLTIYTLYKLEKQAKGQG